MSFGVTDTGFIPKRLADVMASLKARLETITDENGNTLSIDLEDSSLISQFAAITGEAIAEVWEAASMAAEQFDPRYNTGAAQRGVTQLSNVYARASVKAVITATLYGVENTVVTKGSLIATPDKLLTFTCDSDTIIPSGGSVDALFTCTTNAVTSIADASPMSIQSPLAGWTNAVCKETNVVGSLPESDEELRIRRNKSTSLVAYRHTDAILAAVNNVEGVTFSQVYENNTVTTDGKGIPAKSLCFVVVGGVDQDIADAIYYRKSCLSGTYGTTTITYGLNSISFLRPVDLPIHIKVTVKRVGTTYASATDATIIALVKDALMALVTASDSGYVPGAGVYASQLYCAITNIGGLVVSANNLFVGTSASPTTTEVAVDWNKIASFDIANIQVVVV